VGTVTSARRSVLIVLPVALMGAAPLWLASRRSAAPEATTRQAAVPEAPAPSATTPSDAMHAMTRDDAIDAVLDAEGPADEVDSKLWTDLHRWASAESQDIPARDDMTPAQAEKLLDEAADAAGLTTAEAWRSAGRYFQAANFHGLERPACARALDMTAPPPKRTSPAKP
jgi:hypothetical protein